MTRMKKTYDDDLCSLIVVDVEEEVFHLQHEEELHLEGFALFVCFYFMFLYISDY